MKLWKKKTVYSLLTPMSEVAGRMATQAGLRFSLKSRRRQQGKTDGEDRRNVPHAYLSPEEVEWGSTAAAQRRAAGMGAEVFICRHQTSLPMLLRERSDAETKTLLYSFHP